MATLLSVHGCVSVCLCSCACARVHVRVCLGVSVCFVCMYFCICVCQLASVCARVFVCASVRECLYVNNCTNTTTLIICLVKITSELHGSRVVLSSCGSLRESGNARRSDECYVGAERPLKNHNIRRSTDNYVMRGGQQHKEDPNVCVVN